MSGVVERILSAEVSAEDLDRALTAVNSLEPEDHDDAAARVACLIELFGEPGRHEVSARVAAIDWRLQAIARLARSPQFRSWSLAGPDGNAIIAPSCSTRRCPYPTRRGSF